MRTPARVFLTGETPWRGDAECRRENAAVFFPPPHFEMKPEKDEREDKARALCRACPVQRECLEYSLSVQEPHGIWGGLNELERRRLLRQRGLIKRTA
ncbi:MAG TPA: WhiB family transcriptional regulator [Mycobacteriales bacterium]|jgi:WhiB family redox-sensing transcriptional regulator|nr:WhiB family transcriptional regulator [Mycobacteriales bacterium]